MRLERDYQPGLIKRIKELLPGCVILKNDEGYMQGIPDLTIFEGSTYAILEVKRSIDEPYRPNQEYYLDMFSAMGVFATMVCPENERQVLRELKQALRPRR